MLYHAALGHPNRRRANLTMISGSCDAMTSMLAASINPRSRCRDFSANAWSPTPMISSSKIISGRTAVLRANAKTQHHALGIAANWKLQVFAELGKLRYILLNSLFPLWASPNSTPLILMFSYPVASASRPTLRFVNEATRPANFGDAARRGIDFGHHPQQRRLSRPVWTDEPTSGTVFQMQCHMVQAHGSPPRSGRGSSATPTADRLSQRAPF